MRGKRQKRQDELNAYVIQELIELRGLIQQANADHARERAELHDNIVALGRVLNSRTEHLA